MTEPPPETRDEMLSREGGFHDIKAVHFLQDTLRYYRDNAGLEQGKFLLLEETINAAIAPYMWVYLKGVKHGRDLALKETFLTFEEYEELMGDE